MLKNFNFWLKLCVFNFFLVSLIGVMMRYNIAFSLPGISHKFMQESHSHFAFYGWVTAAIYLFVTKYLNETFDEINLKKYQYLMFINQFGSYGMLVTFLYGGYFWLSIVFSSVALLTGFAYFIFLLNDTKSNKNPEIIWLNSAAFFAVFSSVGIFGLAYFSSRKEEFDLLFRASTYFYLHYQYNGFFLFSCIGLLLISLKKYSLQIPKKLNNTIFKLLFFGTLFGYGLSILWMELPKLLYSFFVLISIVQLLGALKLWLWIKKIKIFKHQNFVQKILFSVFGFSFLAKFLMQFLSVFPSFEIYAFGNINIVIAYLHLVFLVGISLFLLWKILETNGIQQSQILKISSVTLIFGILMNEIFLVLSGLFSILLIPFLSLKYGLLFASVVIMISIGVFFFVLKLKKEK